MKTLSIYLESLLDDDDVFYDPKKEIEVWIRNEYKVTGKLTISDDLVVDCSGDVEVKNKNIESLTNGLFRWGKVGGMFDCYACKNLKSLEGAPKEVDGDFNCSYCDSLKSLDGAPKEIGGTFYCFNCAGQFTEDDVKKISNIKNNIICSK